MDFKTVDYDFKGMIVCLRDIFIYMDKLRQDKPIASQIQNPRIPSSFSENLVLFLLLNREIVLDQEVHALQLDRKKADIVALNNNNLPVAIEVKATGKNNFQYFGAKDAKADYIVWLHFGSFFEDPTISTINVFIIKPKTDNLQPQKIDLVRLKRVLKNQSLVQISINLMKYGFC